jgi:hypothetical protein
MNVFHITKLYNVKKKITLPTVYWGQMDPLGEIAHNKNIEYNRSLMVKQ